MSRRLLNAYVLAILVSAGLLFALVLPLGVRERPWTALTLILLAGLGAVRPVRIPKLRVNLTASHPFVLCAIAAAGPVVAILADLLGVIGAALGRDRRPRLRHLAFNLGMAVLGTGWAWAVFDALGGLSGADLSATMIPFSAAALVYFMSKTGLIAIAIALEEDRKILATWKNSFLWTIVPFFAGVTLAFAVLALIEILIPWGILLAVAPSWLLLGVYRAHPDSHHPRPRTGSRPERQSVVAGTTRHRRSTIARFLSH